jgi:hypothetical protein
LNKNLRPLENAQFCSSSRKAIILTAGIHGVFRGLKFEPDAEIEPKGAFCEGLKQNTTQATTRLFARPGFELLLFANSNCQFTLIRFLSHGYDSSC